MADGSIVIDTKIDDTNFKKDLKNIKKTMKISAGALRDIWQGVVPSIMLVVNAFKSLSKVTVGNASAMEDLTASFTPLLGSAEKATELIAKLNKEASSTPFTLDGIGAVAKQLLPAMNGDLEKTTQTFRMLGDTAGGNIEKLQTITRGYMKTVLKGKVDMESLNMISEAGVPIFTELASSMGVSVKEMMSMSSQGKITSNDLTKTFQTMTSEGGIFYKGMEIASETLSGKTSTMKDIFTQIGAVLGEGVLPHLKSAVDLIIENARGFLVWAKEGNKLKTVISNTVEAVKTFILNMANFKDAVIDVAKTLKLNFILAIKTVQIEWTSFISYIDQTIEKVKSLFTVLGSNIVISMIQAISTVKIAFISLAQIIVSKVLGAVEKLLSVMGKLPFVGEKFKEASDSVGAFSRELEKSTEQSKNQAKELIKNAQEVKQKVIESERAKIEAITAERLARIKQLEDSRALTKAQAEAEREEIKKEEKAKIKIIEESELPEVTEELAVEVSKSFARGLQDSAYLALTEVKRLTDNISEGLQNASTGRVGGAISDFLDVVGNIAMGIGQLYSGDISGGLLSLSSGIGGIVDMIGGFVDLFFKAVDYLANFSTEEILNNLDETLSGLMNFFSKELFLISGMFKKGANEIGKFGKYLIDNEEKIFEAIENTINSIAETFNNSTEMVQAITGFVTRMITVVIENLPALLLAGVEIFKAIVSGIVENLDPLIEATMNLINTLVQIVSDNLGEFLTVSLMIILALYKGLLENAPELISAIALIMPELVLAIVEALPMIIEAFAELIPLMILTIIQMIPTLILTWGIILAKLLEAVAKFVIQIPEYFVAMFKGLKKGVDDGVDDLVSDTEELGQKLIDAFKDLGVNVADAFMEGFNNIIDGIKDTFGNIGNFVSGGDTGSDNVILGASKSLASGAKKMFGFASGSANIEQDQIAEIHQGERIIPKSFNESIMSGETLMMNSKAFSSIMNGLQGGIPMPSMTGLKSSTIILKANIQGNIEVDGREIGRTSFEYIDEFAGGAFGS